MPNWRRIVTICVMIPTQRLPASLTPLDTVLAALLDRLEPVPPVEVPLAQALGSIAAEMPPLKAYPPRDIAMVDGWAFRALDLVGVSSYSPLPLATMPVWVEAGDEMPNACDCVIDSDLLDQTGPMLQVLAEAIPGQGVRRAGEDVTEGRSLIVSGRPVRAPDLLIARAVGRETLTLRRPSLLIVDIPDISGSAATSWLISKSAGQAGANVVCATAKGRDAASIAAALDAGACDLLVTIGGSGVGRTDAAIAALAQRGEVIAHGIALQPGRTSGAGKIGKVPVIALAGAADQALAAWWTLARPVLDRLSARQPRRTVTLPLARKIASPIGIAEIVLLERHAGTWMPIAAGALSLDTIARADAYLAIPGVSEGFAAGTPADAYMMWD